MEPFLVILSSVSIFFNVFTYTFLRHDYASKTFSLKVYIPNYQASKLSMKMHKLMTVS